MCLGGFGPALQLETHNCGTVMAPERLGIAGQDAFIMLQGPDAVRMGERRSSSPCSAFEIGVSPEPVPAPGS